MKHTFKVGDGMTTENSTAEERIEIFQLLKDNGYKASLYLLEDCDLTEMGFFWFEDNSFWAETEPYKGAITNPLTYEQMKNYINPTMNTTQAIELLKKGELQIEITDLFEVIMFASKNRLFPQFSYFNNNNYAYFDGDFMRGRECALQDVRVIKLCEIVDDEPKTPSLTIKKIDKSEFNNSFFIDTNDANKTLSDAFKGLDECVQQLKELTVKPIEEAHPIVGKWYKNSDYLICCVGNEKCYGIRLYDEKWLKEENHSEYVHKLANYQPATPAEVIEALKKEAVKRGLVKGAYYGKNKKITSNRYKLLDYGKFGAEWNLNSSIIHILMDENGKWATVAETISLKDAEKELGKKIIV